MFKAGRNVVRWYTSLSTRKPFATAAFSSASILTCSDFTAQSLEHYNKLKTGHSKFIWNYRRTFALATFGFFYYGGPLKAAYMSYERFIKSVFVKTFLDCVVHTPFVLIPVFYLWTCSLKGKSWEQSKYQLREEWTEAALGSFLFWFPTCVVNFCYVPQHSQVLVIASMSFVHKTWLSWVSNRKNNGMESEETPPMEESTSVMPIPLDSPGFHSRPEWMDHISWDPGSDEPASIEMNLPNLLPTGPLTYKAMEQDSPALDPCATLTDCLINKY